MTDPRSRPPRVLLLASDCNPEKPSLPVVGYKYARALARRCDVTLATHIRNRNAIARRADPEIDPVYIDSEHVARPLYKLAKLLRGGTEVAWSTNMIFAWPAYLEFERLVWKRFRAELAAGAFDLVHRITPMSPTLPSYVAGKLEVPFVLGPLNGNLDWPAAYRAEQKREREGLRRLRAFYKPLPYARATYRNAACVLAAFRHTIDDLEGLVDPARIVNMPEVGYDPELFHDEGRRPAPPPDTGAEDAPPLPETARLRFLFVGRLVPYKAAEAVLRAFAASPRLRRHVLEIVGTGPERARLEALVAAHGLAGSVRFTGRLTQAEVAGRMRAADVFAFPSIRELGAGVVVEAMACGMLCVVTDYGAPGSLISPERGLKVPLAPMPELAEGFRRAMETCAAMPVERRRALTRAGVAHVRSCLSWDVKAALTERLYRRLLEGGAGPLPVLYEPAEGDAPARPGR